MWPASPPWKFGRMFHSAVVRMCVQFSFLNFLGGLVEISVSFLFACAYLVFLKRGD